MADYKSKHTGPELDASVDRAHEHVNLDILNQITEARSSYIIEYGTYDEFPTDGTFGVLYLDKSTNKSYRWDSDEMKYYVVGSDYEDIVVIDGGTI